MKFLTGIVLAVSLLTAGQAMSAHRESPITGAEFVYQQGLSQFLGSEREIQSYGLSLIYPLYPYLDLIPELAAVTWTLREDNLSWNSGISFSPGLGIRTCYPIPRFFRLMPGISLSSRLDARYFNSAADVYDALLHDFSGSTRLQLLRGRFRAGISLELGTLEFYGGFDRQWFNGRKMDATDRLEVRLNDYPLNWEARILTRIPRQFLQDTRLGIGVQVTDNSTEQYVVWQFMINKGWK